ncbi:MAG: CRISPR-associated protein Cas4 [Caldilineaceae bacterium]|nr:CRISPR-associated protein Cas4 [Caldilineaceae bacterium]
MSVEAVIEPGEISWLVRVVDLKQYEYCPRIVYFSYCLPGIRPQTYKMKAGIEYQDKTEELEKRRSLREYGLNDGIRHFHVPLTSERYGCVASVDLVVEFEDETGRRLLPVDFKLSRREPGRHFRLQLACYAMMLEESWGAPAPVGVLYLIPLRRAVQVKLDARLRHDAQRKLAQIRDMIGRERMPKPTPQRGRCIDCEFRRFCNDVI